MFTPHGLTVQFLTNEAVLAHIGAVEAAALVTPCGLTPTVMELL